MKLLLSAIAGMTLFTLAACQTNTLTVATPSDSKTKGSKPTTNQRAKKEQPVKKPTEQVRSYEEATVEKRVLSSSPVPVPNL